MQATLGANARTIIAVAQQGVENWLHQQLNLTLDPNDSFATTTDEIWQYFRAKLLEKHGEAAINGDGNNPALPYKMVFPHGLVAAAFK